MVFMFWCNSTFGFHVLSSARPLVAFMFFSARRLEAFMFFSARRLEAFIFLSARPLVAFLFLWWTYSITVEFKGIKRVVCCNDGLKNGMAFLYTTPLPSQVQMYPLVPQG